jgi:hypothetical protein
MPLTGQDGPPVYRYSINKYIGDGVQTNWELSFAGGYISRTHIKAKTTEDDGSTTELLFDWVGDFQVRIDPPVSEGQAFSIYRDTPKTTPVANFTDGAVVNELNLDQNAAQAVFIAAEAIDRGEGALNEISPRFLTVPIGEVATVLAFPLTGLT